VRPTGGRLQIAGCDRRPIQTGVMAAQTATGLFVLALVGLVLVAGSYLRYRLTYRYGERDLEAARRDAAKRSRGVLAGKAGEQLAPLVPAFSDRFDPSEARFLGAPIDYVVFDGIGTGELREVVLVEVKTGRSQLNANEREVERAVAEGRVSFEILRL
jgi:predicted Holliday junction resolvase-like endonuclease